MIKALLLDLDNTLIINPDRLFAVRFLQALSEFLYARWGAYDYVSAYRSALQKKQPTYQNNWHRLIAHLATELERSITDVEATLHAFYTERYPTLEDCVQPVDGARELIQAAQDVGYAVAIATNPLYPLSGVRQRLAWGGLNDDPEHYAFVTNAQNMHFTKPHPAYYAELIGRLGVEPDEAIMIGDGTENDIQAAQAVGIHAIQVDVKSNPQSLSDLLSVINEERPRLPLAPTMICPQFQGNVGALFGLIDTIEDRYWDQHPDPEEWSPIQIVCHLLDSEASTQRPRLQRILHEDDPFITPPKSPPPPQQFNCSRHEGHAVANAFYEERQKTIAFLDQLDPSDWQRPARHSIFGRTTLLEMAQFTASMIAYTWSNCARR